MVKDFLGIELACGDKVVFVAPGYRHLAVGTISRITEKMVFIDYVNDWNFTGWKASVKQTGNQLIRVTT
jgi:acid phosphatase class B